MIQHLKEQYKFALGLVGQYHGHREDLEGEVKYQLGQRLIDRLLAPGIVQFTTLEDTERLTNTLTAHLIVVPPENFRDLHNVLEYILRKADESTDAYKSAKKLIGESETFRP